MEAYEKLAVYMNEIGLPLDPGTFEGRIKTQKLAYLFGKLFEEPLYDDFNFYIRGPYSRKLAKDYYGKTAPQIQVLKPPDEKKKAELKRVRHLANNLSVEELEIVASLSALMDEGLDYDDAADELLKRKPHLTMQKMISGLNRLKEFMLTEEHAKELVKKLKDETEMWDRASNEDFLKSEKG